MSHGESDVTMATTCFTTFVANRRPHFTILKFNFTTTGHTPHDTLARDYAIVGFRCVPLEKVSYLAFHLWDLQWTLYDAASTL